MFLLKIDFWLLDEIDVFIGRPLKHTGGTCRVTDTCKSNLRRKIILLLNNEDALPIAFLFKTSFENKNNSKM